MSDIKQQVVNAEYDYSAGVVNFINNERQIILTLPMEFVINIAKDINPNFPLLAYADKRRKTTIVFIPGNIEEA